MIDSSFFTEIIILINNYIHQIVGGNDFASGMLITGLAGSVVYICKNLPKILFDLMIKHTTTIITFNNRNESFHELTAYLLKNGITKKSRYLKVDNGRFGNSDSNMALGYGKQIFWLNWYTPLLIHIYKEESASDFVKEFMQITKIGRNHNYFDNLLINIRKTNYDKNKTKYYKYNENKCLYITEQPKRTLDTIVLEPLEKESLLKSIDSFLKKEQWYLDYQIPYQLGILLYGPPGTGKSSLIKAIASYFDKDIVFVDSNSSLVKAAQYVKDKIIVAEEIDTFGMSNRGTDEKTDSKESKTKVDKEFDEFFKYSLGQVLGALDGCITNHGRVLIMTTNHVSDLDPALLRPGRIDVKILVSYLSTCTFNEMLRRFFPDFKGTNLSVIDKLSPVDVQNDIVLGLNPEELVDKYCIS